MIIKYSNLASFSLLTLLVLPNFISIGMYTVLLFCMLLFFIAHVNRFFFKDYITFAVPLLILFGLGCSGFAKYQLYDVLKDSWYVFKPIMIIGLGYLIGYRFLEVQTFLRVIVLAAFIVAIVHSLTVFLYLSKGFSLFEIRDLGTRGYFIVSVGIAILVRYWKDIHFIACNRLFYFLAVGVTLLSLIVSGSRTMILVLLIISLFLLGVMKFKLVNFMKFTGLLLVVLIIAFLFKTPSTEGDSAQFFDKVFNSFNEVTISDYTTKKDINIHWRGYESFRALKTYQEGNIFEQMFGQGMGTLVDLGFYIKLGDKDFRYIPILHNGYLYVLVKFGLIGLLVYLYFLVAITRVSASNQAEENQKVLGYLVASLGWCLLITTFSITGVFNKSTMDSAIIIAFSALALIKKDAIKQAGRE